MTTITAPELTGTIQRLDGTLSYRNPFLRVDTDQVRFPDDSSGHHSKVTAGTGLGVIATPVARFRGQIYLGLVRQHRYPVDEHTLEFPRGDSKDLGRDEAARALFEETGLFPESASRIGVLRPDTGVLTTKVAVWRTGHRITPIEANRPRKQAAAMVTWYRHGEVTGMIRDGRISCGMTMAAMAILEASEALKSTFQ